MSPTFSIVVPAYNEELVIAESYKRLTEALSGLNNDYELIFINDGSRDKTAPMIYELWQKDRRVKLISLSRNFGHQPAITAGMDYARGQAIVIIDADLQDPPRVILEMIEKWREGYQVVYGKRRKRKGETWFKKVTAKIFYRTLRSLTNIDIPVDTGDFRLIDRKVCDAMKSLPERNRYVRGLVSWVGFKQTAVEYDREERFAGETKYPLKKMIKFAKDGITSFSYKPLKLATTIGFFISLLSFLYILIVIYQKVFLGTTPIGWASIIAIVSFFQGLVLIMLGVIGEYIGRIYDEVKGRPIYVINEAVGFDEKSENYKLKGIFYA
jgi:polyisoprenyl-phosphate glycosyltransferase